MIGWCDIIPKNQEGFTHVGNLGIGLLAEYRHKGIGSVLLQKPLNMRKKEITLKR